MSPRSTRADAAPLFAFGVDHSGTTIVYRMLAYHPDLTWFSQFSLRRGEIPGRTRRPGASRLEPMLRRLPHLWRKEDPWPRRLVVPRPDADERIWNCMLDDEGAAVERVRTCLTAFSEHHGGRRVLAKRPAFDRHLGVLRAAFPAARFVHIIRDGRPVALSGRAKILAARAGAEAQPDPDAALHEAASHWVEVMQRAASAPIDLLEVRYEDFCEDVHGALRAMLRHADLDPESFPFRRCPQALENRNPRWVDAALDRELAEISGIQRDLLIHYGYEADAVGSRS